MSFFYLYSCYLLRISFVANLKPMLSEWKEKRACDEEGPLYILFPEPNAKDSEAQVQKALRNHIRVQKNNPLKPEGRLLHKHSSIKVYRSLLYMLSRDPVRPFPIITIRWRSCNLECLMDTHLDCSWKWMMLHSQPFLTTGWTG